MMTPETTRICDATNNEDKCPSYDVGDCNNQFISHDREHPIKCHDVKKCNWIPYNRYLSEYSLIDKIERNDSPNKENDTIDSTVRVTHYPHSDIQLNEEDWYDQVKGFFGQIGYEIVELNEPHYNYLGYWVKGIKTGIKPRR